MIVAILAGGKGKRLVPNKSFLEVDGRAIIRRQLDVLKEVFEDILLVTNTSKIYEGLNLEIICDIIADKGPLGGIYSALKNIKDRYCFVIAADMPYPNIGLIRYMKDNINGSDIVLATNSRGRLEPLYGFYSKSCIPAIEQQLKNNNLKIRDLLEFVKVKKIGQELVSGFDPQGLTFTNINTQEDYDKLTK